MVILRFFTPDTNSCMMPNKPRISYVKLLPWKRYVLFVVHNKSLELHIQRRSIANVQSDKTNKKMCISKWLCWKYQNTPHPVYTKRTSTTSWESAYKIRSEKKFYQLRHRNDTVLWYKGTVSRYWCGQHSVLLASKATIVCGRIISFESRRLCYTLRRYSKYYSCLLVSFYPVQSVFSWRFDK